MLWIGKIFKENRIVDEKISFRGRVPYSMISIHHLKERISSGCSLFKIIESILVILNILIFLYSNTRPILWQQSEITYHHFFWSLDQPSGFTLHTGFSKQDFLKIFAAPKIIEGDLRTRHFSYLLEMASFKIGQLLEIVSFRDYFHIILHVLNVYLTYLFIFHLTANRKASILGALVLLNSGAALATLSFPFRSSKMLIMTLFLCAGVVALSSQNAPMGKWRWAIFSTIIFLALFTDEYIFFLFPLLLLIIFSQGIETWKDKKTRVTIALPILLYGVAIYFCIIVSGHLGYSLTSEYYQLQLTSIISHLHNFSAAIMDTSKAFLFYFLRRNFGYWDFTVFGLGSFVAAVILGVMCVRYFPRREKKYLRIMMGVLVVICFKAAFFISTGYHHDIMPPGTQFPSLLFFSWYYVYCEAVLLSILVGISLKDAVLKNRNSFLSVMILVTIIGFSSASHLKGGPQDALLFHGYGNRPDNFNIKVIKDILAVSKVLKNNQDKTVYLSFPSPWDSIYKMEVMVQPHSYANYLPVLYLRSIEKGRAVISLQNAKPKNPFSPGEEVMSSDLIYDVYTGQKFDLAILKETLGQESLKPSVLLKESKLSFKTTFPEILFFLQGRASFEIKMGEKSFRGKQSYGHSYEMFRIGLPKVFLNDPDEIMLTVSPLDESVCLIGPFLIDQK